MPELLIIVNVILVILIQYLSILMLKRQSTILLLILSFLIPIGTTFFASFSDASKEEVMIGLFNQSEDETNEQEKSGEEQEKSFICFESSSIFNNLSGGLNLKPSSDGDLLFSSPELVTPPPKI
jgi:uncharacterized protein YacL